MCDDTPIQNATRIAGANKLLSVLASNALACKLACCADLGCVAWTFAGRSTNCSLFSERGLLAEADMQTLTAFKAMSVPMSDDWPWSWDTVPLYTHTSNSSGFFSPRALANLTALQPFYSPIVLDWEVNYTSSKSHHLRHNTVQQAQDILNARPGSKVMVYQQGNLANNYTNPEAAALKDPSKASFWAVWPSGPKMGQPMINDGSIDCEWGWHCEVVMNATNPALRRWFVNEVALPTLSEPAVSGIFYDNSMCFGQQVEDEAWMRTAQQGSVDLQREIGEATLAFPGKRTMLSVKHVAFTDNQIKSGNGTQPWLPIHYLMSEQAMVA